MSGGLSSDRRRAGLGLLGVLALFAVGGLAAAVLWHGLWSPPSGVAVKGTWYLDGQGLPQDFSGTGLYVLIALAFGLVLGLLATWLAGRTALLGLAVTLLGCALASWLMLRLGHALGPPDPRPLAVGKPDLTPIPSDLHVVGKAPFVAWPMGALVGYLVGSMLAGWRARPEPRQ